MTTIPTADVVVGTRFRKDPGDLESLADSIREVGLLHPIVVDSEGGLVAGARRLQACRDLLGWKEIPARVVDEVSPDTGELNENQARKELTDYERWELIENFVKKHRTANWQCGQFTKRQITIEAAAKENGSNGRRHFRITQIIRNGIPELKEAWLADEITISAAAVIAAQPEDRQREIMALPARARKEEVRRLREEVAQVKRRPQQGAFTQAARTADEPLGGSGRRQPRSDRGKQPRGSRRGSRSAGAVDREAASAGRGDRRRPRSQAAPAPAKTNRGAAAASAGNERRGAERVLGSPH